MLDGTRPLGQLVERLESEGRLVRLGVSGDSAVAARLGLRGVAEDSRRIRTGELFVAVPGLRSDGHAFIGDALERGAAALIVERPAAAAVPQLVVDRAAVALGSAAAWWYGDPSRELLTIGVTGTNGKTTTTFLAAAAVAAAGLPAGLVGTVGVRAGGRLIRNEEPQTTPPATELQRILRGMRLAGDAVAVIETSSHGLAAERVASVAYDAAIFTNLGHEHLDFHGTFEAYRAAKLSLFERLPARSSDGERPGLGVVNVDDANGPAFLAATIASGARPVAYGAAPDAEVRLLDFAPAADASRLVLRVGRRERRLRLRLPGRFNAANALAVMALAHGWDLDLDAVTAALEATTGVPGRMEPVDLGQPFAVIVDYAHTPEAIEAVLRELRPLAAPGRGVISVLGASGERDLGKRPLMGAAAARHSRLVVVTQDDPRGEDVMAINEAIATGAEGAGAVRGRDLLVVADRSEAIHEALRRAGPGEVVLIAGKGHETWNMGPDGPQPWSDRAVVESALRALGFDDAAGAPTDAAAGDGPAGPSAA